MPYLADFIKDRYGDPVKLERDSPEARIVRKYLKKLPQGKQPDTGEGANLTIVIPWFKEIDRRTYNYIGQSAKDLLIDSFNQMLEKSMLDEIRTVENYFSGSIANLIYAWMEKHNIEDNQTNC
jgi:hypothetical protein